MAEVTLRVFAWYRCHHCRWYSKHEINGEAQGQAGLHRYWATRVEKVEHGVMGSFSLEPNETKKRIEVSWQN